MEISTAKVKRTEAEKVAEVSHRMEAMTTMAEPHFKMKRGSVIPKKRRSIKKLIFYLLFSFLCKQMAASPPTNIKKSY